MTDTNPSYFYNGVEHSIVGLSPQYWSYTPMLIGDVHRLVLANGIDCILYDDSTDDNSLYLSKSVPTKEKRSVPRPFRLLPVSRCELCGIIVNLEHRSNGAVFVLVDDGTGFIDCISWGKSNNNFRAIPPLLPFAEETISKSSEFQVGDSVRILGKIKCLTIASDIQDGNIRTENLLGETKTQQMNLYYECKREIQVIHMEHANNDHPNSNHPNDLHLNNNHNLEVLHWLKCLHFAQRLKTSKKRKHTKINIGIRDDSDKDSKSQKMIPFEKKIPSNSIETNVSSSNDDDDDTNDENDDFYNHLCDSLEIPIPNGPDILRDISENTTTTNIQFDFDTAHKALSGHDAILTKRLFGKKCRCNLSYQSELLYCHCIATYEQLDPQFQFRDAIIQFLLHIEHQLPPATTVNDESKKDANDDKTKSFFALVDNHPCLKFSYKDLLSNNDLAKLASDIVSSTSNPTINQKRIYIRSLSALRNDGIIFLLNDNMDDYALLSYKCILRPYLKQIMSGNGSQKKFNKYERPNFLTNVPQSRLNYAEALISEKFI